MTASAHLRARREQIHRRGRPMVLSRPSGPSVTVLGFAYALRPDQVADGLKQGDRQVEVLDDDIAAASWPGPPKVGDRLQVDGKTAAVLIAETLYDGPTLLGHRLFVRG